MINIDYRKIEMAVRNELHQCQMQQVEMEEGIARMIAAGFRNLTKQIDDCNFNDVIKNFDDDVAK